MRVNYKDVAAGGFFMIVGGYFAIDAILHLRMGDAIEMGPGYFPRLLGFILMGIGLVIALNALGKENNPIEKITWRGLALILASIIFFGATIRGLGMFPTLVISTYLATIASGKMSHWGSVLTGIIISAFCVLIFIVLLRLPYPIFGPWLKIIGGQ